MTTSILVTEIQKKCGIVTNTKVALIWSSNPNEAIDKVDRSVLV